MGAYCILPIHDFFDNSSAQLRQRSILLPKQSPVNKIVRDAMEISSNIGRLLTMYLGTDSVNFVVQSGGVWVVAAGWCGAQLFCGNLQTLLFTYYSECTCVLNVGGSDVGGIYY